MVEEARVKGVEPAYALFIPTNQLVSIRTDRSLPR